jgi:hypothetical protein
LRLPKPGKVTLTARIAAHLPAGVPAEFASIAERQKAPADAAQRRGDQRFAASYRRPYWNLERARLGQTRTVPVEVIVNGRPIARKVIAADGQLRDITFDVTLERSSWVALRILPSSHTNPVFVLVNDQPIRASKRSLEWCLASVDRCWSQKESTYAPPEMAEARAAYDHARQVYRTRLAEAVVE